MVALCGYCVRAWPRMDGRRRVARLSVSPLRAGGSSVLKSMARSVRLSNRVGWQECQDYDAVPKSRVACWVTRRPPFRICRGPRGLTALEDVGEFGVCHAQKRSYRLDVDT